MNHGHDEEWVTAKFPDGHGSSCAMNLPPKEAIAWALELLEDVRKELPPPRESEASRRLHVAISILSDLLNKQV